MSLFISTFIIYIYQIYGDSNYNRDYPNLTYCILPEVHPTYTNSKSMYTYLTKQLRLDRRCTHIRGSLYIEDLHRFENGTDYDLSFLESIVEISGILRIRGNSIRRIPLGNLKSIRGILTNSTNPSLQVSHNIKNPTEYLEDLDLHSLRVIMNKDVRINLNAGLGYLVHKVDWSEIVMNSSSQRVTLQFPSEIERNITDYICHPSCEPWIDKSGNLTQFCFGPRQEDCQQRAKCSNNKFYTWCQFNKGAELPCDRQCVGGCVGNRPQDCMACKRVYKKDQCVSHCALEHDVEFGVYKDKDIKDALIYTTGALCTSQCPESLLDQEKICVYQCDLSKYYKNGNRCIECPYDKCYVKIGDQFMCDLKKLDWKNITDGKTRILDKDILQKLTLCTIIIGQLYIDDNSFLNGVTVPMLYDHLKNVREIIGGLTIHLVKTVVSNLTFFSNLREIRGTVSNNNLPSGLHIFISSLEFFGLKRLEKVYGVVNYRHKSNLCYDNTIPWSEIAIDKVSQPKCDKKCHPLCTRGCWGPGNTLCYKCEFLESGDFCVKNCSDAPGFFTNKTLGCESCHRFCRDNCTGPTARDCVTCLFAKENENCVKSCSSAYYPVNSAINGEINCKPCHQACFVGENLKIHNISSACSGPSNNIGQGGCAMCHKVITKDNANRCHYGKCPKGFFENKLNELLNAWSVQQISCDPCHPLCDQCSDKTNLRTSCQECKGFWYNEYCERSCPKMVRDIDYRDIKLGDHCPTCHPECTGGCQTVNDNTTCARCTNKKLFLNDRNDKFVCVANCPATRNYTDYLNGNFVCLRYEETSSYQQRKRILFVAIGSLACLVIMVTGIVIFFRWKSRQSKIAAELKAFYSNFNETDTKNSLDHIDRPPNKNRLQMIPIKDLIFDIKSKPLGAGAFGKVYRGYWKVPGLGGKQCRLDVVVKIINNSSKASTNEFLEEAKIMASVSHRYCLPLIGVCLSLKKPCLVSAFAEYGSLEKYLHSSSSKLSSYTLLKWSQQIADGMAYLNMRGIIHRDLATRNILVTHKNIVQITDFGLAKLVDDTDDGIVVQSGRVPIRWLALETLLHSNYSSASDVWAYGITLWELFTFGKRPYGELETSNVKNYLMEGNRLSQPEICTLDVYMVMIKCWLDDPRMRPSFTELTSTFDQFSHNSKRYICILKEHANEYTPDQDDAKEQIRLDPISIESQCERPVNFSVGIDNLHFQQVPDNDSDQHSINPLYYKDDTEDITILPMRKKRKRNVSFEKLKNFPKIGFTNLLATKSSDSNSSQYSPSSSFSSRKNPRIRYDSTSALISHQISFECEGSPINPQIAKLLKQESWPSNRTYQSSNKEDPLQRSDTIYNDQNLKENSERNSVKLTEQNVCSRSPSLSSFDASRQPLIAQNSNDIDGNLAENSPDSGNSHEFEMDEYLIPSRIHSLGYYNVTPSPTDTVKPAMDLSESNYMVQNANYNQIIDDGYLEPISTPTLTR